MTTFYEQRLDLGINYGATFGPRFNTAILTQSDGQEQRRALWSQPLLLAQLGDRRVTQSELNTLLAFHATVKGAAIGFRLRDWSDYKATNQAIGTGDGTEQTWQLVKTYSISTATVTRPITKPVAGSVVVYVDGVEEETGWSVDTTTGVLTTELTGLIAVDFEFDVPVRFEQDKIDFTFEAKGLFTLAPLTCTEIRVEPTIYPALDTLPGSLEEIIDLGYDFGTLGGPSFSTGIKANAAEFELRKPRWEASIGSWDIGDRLLIRSELDYLIRLFRVCRGMAIPFQFKDWQSNTTKKVRFAEDRISFRFEAIGGDEVIFGLGGVAVAEVAEKVVDETTYIYEMRATKYLNGISQGIQKIGGELSVIAPVEASIIFTFQLKPNNGGEQFYKFGMTVNGALVIDSLFWPLGDENSLAIYNYYPGGDTYTYGIQDPFAVLISA